MKPTRRSFLASALGALSIALLPFKAKAIGKLLKPTPEAREFIIADDTGDCVFHVTRFKGDPRPEVTCNGKVADRVTYSLNDRVWYEWNLGFGCGRATLGLSFPPEFDLLNVHIVRLDSLVGPNRVTHDCEPFKV